MVQCPPPPREFFESLISCTHGRADLRTLRKEPLLQFLDLVLSVVSAEPSLIEWEPRETIIVGDTHCDYLSSTGILYSYPSTPLVFLGDYSGRSKEKLDDFRNCLLLFLAKLLNRERIVLLRGNHEDEQISCGNGFQQSISELFGEVDGKVIWKKFVEVFHQLPLCLSMKDIIILHGAMPRVTSLDEIRTIPKGISFCDNPLLTQILWNDVTTRDALVMSDRCPDALCYGKTTLTEFLASVQKKVLIHGHNYSGKGVSFDGANICLYTCETYFYLPRGTPEDLADVQMPVPGNLIARFDGQKTIDVCALPAFQLGETPLLEVQIPPQGTPTAAYLNSFRSQLFHFFHERLKKK